MSEQIKAGYTTLLGAAKRIGIKRQTVEDWVILGILELEDGLVPLETVEKVREQDKKYISLESFLKNVKAERFNNKLYKHRELYLRYLWENKFWGFKTTKPNEVRYPFEKNVSLYFLRSDISSLREKSEDFFESFGLNEKEKCEWLIEKRCSSKKIKDLLVDYLKKIDSYTVTVTEFVRNALDVDFENYDMITEGRRIDELKYENSKVLLKDFTDKVAKKLKLGFIVDEPLGTKEEKPTKEISAYSREVYLGIIKEVFNEENIRKNGVLTKALDKSFYY